MSLRLIIASQKGGVGKTTMSMNLSVAFAESGYRTLLVDSDPQGAINLSLGKGSLEYPGIMEIISGKADAQSVLVQTNLDKLKLLPKGRMAMKNVPVYERKLYQDDIITQILNELDSQFDIIIVDTPAGLGMITRAAMRAGSHVLVPFKVDTLNLRSINQILQVIDHVQKDENPKLQFLGLILTMFEKDVDSSFRVAGEVWRDFPMVLDTTIPRAEIFQQASEMGVPLAFIGSRRHPEASRFMALGEEIISLVYPEEESDKEQKLRRLL